MHNTKYLKRYKKCHITYYSRNAYLRGLPESLGDIFTVTCYELPLWNVHRMQITHIHTSNIYKSHKDNYLYPSFLYGILSVTLSPAHQSTECQSLWFGKSSFLYPLASVPLEKISSFACFHVIQMEKGFKNSFATWSKIFKWTLLGLN